MDSFGLRQEQSELLKSVSDLKHKLEIGEARIKELHSEEMRYLEEIPVYKKQAQESKIQASEASGKVAPLQKILEDAQKELIKVQGLTARENQSLLEIKETEKNIIEENKIINEQIKQRHSELKQREFSIADREKCCDLREVGYKDIQFGLDNREVEISKKEQDLNKSHEKLEDKLETHKNNVELHNAKVDSLIEAKESHLQDEQILANKQARVEKLIKDNTELKAALLLQSDKLSKEITITQGKQVSLDRSLADLVNQENTLKIKELKIQKLAHDKGLEKELKELQESLK